MEHKPTIRVLEIQEALAAENQGVSLTHLSEKTGILKGTIFPILKTLVEQRYISYDANTQLYNLGISCSILSRAFLDRSYWLKMVYKEMNNIVKECNEVCQMGILDGADVLYINKVQAAQTVQLVSHIGTRLPAIYSALGKAIMSIGAVKGFEIGDGFEAAASLGSQDNDCFIIGKDGRPCKVTNHSGGTLGGMSDGSTLVMRAAFKPTPSISQIQKTVDRYGKEREIEIKGRHDPVIVPRAVVVVEAMAALTVADLLLMSMTSRLDKIKKFFKKEEI